MIREFHDQGTEDVFNGKDSRRARNTLPRELWKVAQRKLDWLNTALSLHSLRTPPSNHLEALRNDRSGQHAIRINRQYRICFVWTDEGPTGVEITDYH